MASYNRMCSHAPIRIAVLAALLTAPLLAQPPRPQQVKPTAAVSPASSLPATPQTVAPQTVEPPPIPLTPAQLPPRHAQIAYAGGALSVSADNSSLNQILRQISSLTGIKITGGVADERVFGQYGPAAPPQILAELLTGTASNMVIQQRDENGPAELILTPRQGGPTPPNPNAAAFDDRSEQAERPEQREQPQPEQAQPAAAVPTPPVTPAPAALSPGQIPTTADPSQPDSPNGVKTPQQIYEQLQRMRQQQTPPQ